MPLKSISLTEFRGRYEIQFQTDKGGVVAIFHADMAIWGVILHLREAADILERSATLREEE